MNNRQRGRLTENIAKEHLLKQGWEVEQVRGTFKFNKSCDFFGIGDLICLKHSSLLKVTKILIVQVKTNKRMPLKDRDKMISFKTKYPDIMVQEWVYFTKNKECFAYKYDRTGEQLKQAIKLN